MKKKRIGKVGRTVLAGLFWIIVWTVIARLIGNALLFPSPLQTVIRLVEMAGEAVFWQSLGMSFFRVGLGILIAIVLGILGGILSGISSWAQDILKPFLAVLRSTPVASFIVLLIIWMDRNAVPVVVSVITMMPVVLAGVETGIRQTDKGLKELAQVCHLSFADRFRGVYFPSIYPYFTASVVSSLGMAWKSSVAAEVIAMPLLSVGRRMYYASNNLDTAGVFAWTAAVVLLSVLIQGLISFLLKNQKKRNGAS